MASDRWRIILEMEIPLEVDARLLPGEIGMQLYPRGVKLISGYGEVIPNGAGPAPARRSLWARLTGRR